MEVTRSRRKTSCAGRSGWVPRQTCQLSKCGGHVVATVIELRSIRRLSASPHSPSTYLRTPCPSTNSYCLPGALGLLGSGPDSYKARVLWLPHATPRELVAYHNPDNVAFLLNLATSAPGVALTPVQALYGLGEVCPHRSSCTMLTRVAPRTAHCFPACPRTPQPSEAERSPPHTPCACRTHWTPHTLQSSGTAASAGPAARRTPGRHVRRHHAQKARAAGFGYVANGAAGICFVADGALALLALAPPLPAPAPPLPDPAAAPAPAPAASPHRPRHPRVMYLNLDLHFTDGVAHASHVPAHGRSGAASTVPVPSVHQAALGFSCPARSWACCTRRRIWSWSRRR
jgi:hypothetical protein